MSGKWIRSGLYWEIENPQDEQSITFSLDQYLPRGAKVTGVKLTYITNDEYVAGDVVLELIAYDSTGDQTTDIHSSVEVPKATSNRKVALSVPTRYLMGDGRETMIRARYTAGRAAALFRLLGVNVTYTYTNRPAPYPLTRLVAVAAILAAQPTSESSMIWEWNGQDTTQFESSALVVTDTGGGGTPVISLTAVTDSTKTPYGKYLQLHTQDGSGFFWSRVWLARTHLPLEYRMEIDYEVIGSGVGGTNGGSGALDNSVGLALLGHETGGQFTGVGFTPSWMNIQGGAVASTSYAAAAARVNSTLSPSYNHATVRVHAVKASGAPPTFNIRNDQRGTESLTNPNASKYTAAEHLTQASLTLGAAWNGSACDRFGLAVRTSTGSRDLRIYRWRVFAGT